MANISGINLKPGDILYHPIVDHGVGFAIEEVSVVKLVGPGGNPYGYSWIMWTYGNVAFIKEQDIKRQGAARHFLKKDCFFTIEECIEYLEGRRLRFIESQKDKKEQIIAEVLEVKKFLEETKKESVEVSRQVNKNVAMLNRLDIRRDLEKRGLI